MDWVYVNLVDGRLVYDDGGEINSNWPSFATFEEAEAWLEENDIRATVR